MKSRHLLMAALVAAPVLLTACNGSDGNGSSGGNVVVTPTPSPIDAMTTTVSRLAAMLIAMVSGSACATAPPTDINGINFAADDTPVEANELTPSCTG